MNENGIEEAMAEIKIGKMTMGVCQTNCYFLYREGSTDVIFVDPAERGASIYEALKERGFQVKAILLTHGHFDHIWGVKALQELSGAKVYAYAGEKDVCEDADINLSAGAGRAETVDADVYAEDGEMISAAGMNCRLLATPGHTKGSCCYYFEEAGILLSGDTLFRESVGRTDFATGSMSDIVRSVKEKLFVLPEKVKVYPGHGENTTIGYEKQFNPYCQ